MTTLNELPQKETINNNDSFLLSDSTNNDAKASAEQLKNYFAPAATQNRAGVVTTEAQQFAGNKTFNNNVDIKGEITQNGEPLITDVEISEEEGNALEKKDDGLYVSQAAAGLPIGTIISWPSDTLPSGFLKFDGTTYNKADYPELYAKLPSAWKTESAFTLPDLDGLFVQGAGDNLGDLIAAGLPNITGKVFSFISGGANVNEGALSQSASKGAAPSTGSSNQWKEILFNAADGETDTDGNLKTVESEKVFGKSNTVQPPAVALNIIIKATNFTEPSAEVIDDTRTTTGNVWSASKVAAELAAVDNKNNYSSNETIIGTWIDGKPIYRVVLSSKTLTTSWQQVTTSGNINLLIRLELVLGNNNRCGAILQSKIISNNLYLARYSDENITNSGIIIEYTKTTD